MKSKTSKEIPIAILKIPAPIKGNLTPIKGMPTLTKEIPAFLEANATKGPHRTILRYQIKFEVMKS